MAKPKKRPQGKPPHKPTDDTRKTVRAMTGYGIHQTDIGKVIGISKPTLEKYYRVELDTGMIVANAKVAESLFEMATKLKVPSAAIYWMKVRCGWYEQSIAPVDASELARKLNEAQKEIEESDGPDGKVDKA